MAFSLVFDVQAILPKSRRCQMDRGSDGEACQSSTAGRKTCRQLCWLIANQQVTVYDYQQSYIMCWLKKTTGWNQVSRHFSVEHFANGLSVRSCSSSHPGHQVREDRRRGQRCVSQLGTLEKNLGTMSHEEERHTCLNNARVSKISSGMSIQEK